MPPRRRHRRDPAAVAGMLGPYRSPPGGVARPAAPSAAPDVAGLVAAWPQVAGSAGTRSVPVRVSRAGVVSVACADAGLAQTLAFREGPLMSALEAATGRRLRALRFVVADHAVAFPVVATPPRPVKPTRAARDAAHGLVAATDDEHLRAVLERAAAASIQRSWDGG